MKEVGGLSGSMRTGVTVLEGAEVYLNTSGEGEPVVQPLATDMRVPVAPVTNQQAGADDPHVLGEEGYVAAAVSASFNAPIAGALFAAEVIITNLKRLYTNASTFTYWMPIGSALPARATSLCSNSSST